MIYGGIHVTDNSIGLLRSVINSSVPLSFRDPQEYIFAEPRNEASDVYSYGMMLFTQITGKNYFQVINIPEDEYFMSCDPENDFSVISPDNVPVEYSDIAQLISKMTMFNRNSRISMSELKGMIHENLTENGISTEEKEYNIQASESNDCNAEEFPVCRNGFDYGVIINNKRFGRIEFVKLLSSSETTGKYIDIPADSEENFKIPISVRSFEKSGITNPSSVYGDCIIPTAMIITDPGKSHSVRIALKKENNIIIPLISFTDISGNIISEHISEKTQIIPYKK